MDKYTVIRKIGQGSFGNVLLLRCKKTRQKHVLKIIYLHNLNDRDLRATHQEVHLLAFLDHPNIVSYKEAFKTKEGFLYIIMLYCEGGDMYSKIKNQKGIYFPEKQIIQWTIQLCLALQYLHDKKILHRDLKTRNIFLTKNDNVKIGDFGIAKILDSEDSMANTMTGTPYYMSPEMFSKKSYNYKSDVWSLGCCIYEIAALRHAFYASDISALMQKILRGKLPAMPLHYNFELLDLICSLLHLEPKKRPSPIKILHNPFIVKHVKMFFKARKTNGLSDLSAISETNIWRKGHHKNISKTSLNHDKEDQLIREVQGLKSDKRLQTQIAYLRRDCRSGLGQDVLLKALHLVNQFNCKSLQLGLKRLLGKENYNNYVGKILQLKLCEDSALGTKD
uniref:non-specific serine/threonine protein kinase n=1 Tax=Strigamia maritima TaxID=126957 RepID=T1J4E5_STRMM